ncbi:MAG: hypothetical protein RLZZ618_4234 [Pseudomonadota bacterium]|jgi:pimeloyl-ACP methyl ester carboxylesterase
MTSLPSLLPSLQVDGVDVFIEGGEGSEAEGKDTIVMIHGWPDTCQLWDAQVAFFKGSYRCVRFTLPGFDVSKPRRLVSADDMVGTIKRIVETVSPGRPVTLMIHDWGCIFGGLLAQLHPSLVSRIVAVDVGDASTPEHLASLSRLARGMVSAYQGLLSLAWRIGGKFGDGLTRRMATALKAPGPLERISSAMNFPYFLLRSGGYAKYLLTRTGGLGFPMLFIYGTAKPFLFHTKAWADKVAAKPGNQVVAVDCGHWVMHEQTDTFNATVHAWLEK